MSPRGKRPHATERDETVTKFITPKELAEKLDTDPRTLRKFLRSNARKNGIETPGKGSRWEIDSKTVPTLRKGFKVWNDARAEKPDETS